MDYRPVEQTAFFANNRSAMNKKHVTDSRSFNETPSFCVLSDGIENSILEITDFVHKSVTLNEDRAYDFCIFYSSESSITTIRPETAK